MSQLQLSSREKKGTVPAYFIERKNNKLFLYKLTSQVGGVFSSYVQ